MELITHIEDEHNIFYVIEGKELSEFLETKIKFSNENTCLLYNSRSFF